MTALGGYRDRIARVNLGNDTVQYEGIDDEDAKKYIGGRGLGVKYVFDNGPDVDPLSPENILAFMTGPLTGSQRIMSGRLAVCTKSPLTGTVTDSHQGGWSGARLKWAGLDGLVFDGTAEDPVYAYVEDGEVELRDASDIWGLTVHETRDYLEDALDGEYGQNLSMMAIGPAGENLVRYASIMNEDDRASGRGGVGCVMGSKNIKAVVIKSETDMMEPADPETFQQGSRQALQVIQESDVTAPNEGGLSVYGTNVLMNIDEEMDGLPTRNGRYTSAASEAEHDPSEPNVEAEKVSGEWVRENILIDEPTCHSCPVACKKEVEVDTEVDTEVDGEPAHVRMESVEYESAWTFGVNSMNDDAEKVAVMIDRCNELGLDTIEMGDMLSVLMDATEKGRLDGADRRLEWGEADEMIELIEAVAHRDGEVADVMADGQAAFIDEFDAQECKLAIKNQGMPAYDPRGIKGMGLSYATSNRGGCHLRGYTVASEVLGVPEKTDPLESEGKPELLITFQDLAAVIDSLDVCKFTSFAEGLEEYVLTYNGMTGRDLTEDELYEAGTRIYALERYYNNLNGFDGADDTLPGRFVEGHEDAIPGQGAAEGELCPLDEMKAVYYEEREWEDGVVTDEKLAELNIEVGPGTGVSSGPAAADD